MRILLVDDDIHSLDPLAKLLRLGGFDVVPTNLATRAVTLLSTQRFDVVITDLEMPDVGGGVLLHVARACQREARLIAISGSVGRDAVSTSDVTFLAKPIDLDELLAVIHSPAARRSSPDILRADDGRRVDPTLLPMCMLGESFVEGLLVVDASRRVVMTNRAAERIFRAKREDLLRPVQDYPARFGLSDAVKALTGDVVGPVEHDVGDGDPASCRVRISAAPVRDCRHAIVGALIVVSELAAQAANLVTRQGA